MPPHKWSGVISLWTSIVGNIFPSHLRWFGNNYLSFVCSFIQLVFPLEEYFSTLLWTTILFLRWISPDSQNQRFGNKKFIFFFFLEVYSEHKSCQYLHYAHCRNSSDTVFTFSVALSLLKGSTYVYSEKQIVFAIKRDNSWDKWNDKLWK